MYEVAVTHWTHFGKGRSYETGVLKHVWVTLVLTVLDVITALKVVGPQRAPWACHWT